MTIILCTVGLGVLEVGIVSSGHRHPVANRVAADDEATGMNTRTTNCSLQHLGILDRIAQGRVIAGLSIAQFGRTLDSVGKVHLHAIGQTVGNGLAQGINNTQRHFLHTCHILDRVLGGHCGVSNDMRAVLMTILILNPFQHLASSVIVEVGIDIGQ